ncbi:aminomethyl-transferring glycine dehydrogenase subunit GcvPB [Burkholderia gladioli]|uniref:aminomethyl-transferring glycine dehydrogenase subunit GcvPB n=1 Tax=Burkholderia gladioli TaxID=28095 RepID=UPI001641153C|nr:aminomethyl-transferring glycine dehydrogenase subunit GcvPB [Burkholderia gladioli]
MSALSVMHNPYACHDREDVRSMLESMGLRDIEQLLRPIPGAIRLGRDLDLPAPLDEGQSDRLIRQRAALNQIVLSRTSFLGAGLYEHTIPAVVDYLAERGEFLTSYTPYQPRMSQGSLEVLWEYQQMMQSILGMPVVNASCYDGSTAMADAFNMVCHSERLVCGTIAMARTVWPATRTIVESSFAGKAIGFVTCDAAGDGRLDLAALEAYFVAHRPLAFGFQSPNCFGILEDIEAVAAVCRRHGVSSVLYYHPFLSGLFVTPGKLGVDIVCGEGQMLGNPLNAGGASLGFLGCQRPFASAIPGRMVGLREENGERLFALVNEEREQHVAREHATSNICTNQANNVMRATFFLALQGDAGLEVLARRNAANARRFCERLLRIDGVRLHYSGAFFNEFLVSLPVQAAAVLNALREHGIYGGVDAAAWGYPSSLLIAVTETKDDAQLDEAARIFEGVLNALRAGMPLEPVRQRQQHQQPVPVAIKAAGPPRREAMQLPDLSESDVVRHYTRLCHKNHGIDQSIYPLGSCTMKYNPKRNDKYAALDGFRHVHPLQPVDDMQGLLLTLHELETYLAELTGMDAVSLHPAAGAHGELTGLLMIRKYFTHRQDPRDTLLIADSAHGTNPSSATMAGFRCEIIATGPDGLLDLDDLRRKMGPRVAGLMITNPSTLGLFEENIETVARIVHDQGGLLYYDGANMNALMGLVRPGDMGFDIVHLNVHKTLSTPHGGGGPGAGPLAVKSALAVYLPVPRIVYDPAARRWRLEQFTPLGIGRIKQHFGHVSVLIRAWSYIRTLGAKGLREASEHAILNANYLQYHLSRYFPSVFGKTCMHECLLAARNLHKPLAQLAGGLIAAGVHPPTLMGAGCVWFPGALSGAMLIEPTETESRASLDGFIEAMNGAYLALTDTALAGAA